MSGRILLAQLKSTEKGMPSKAASTSRLQRNTEEPWATHNSLYTSCANDVAIYEFLFGMKPNL